MTPREAVARALAFFESTDDIGLLHESISEIAPRVRRQVASFLARGNEDDPARDRPEPRNPAGAAGTIMVVSTMSNTLSTRMVIVVQTTAMVPQICGTMIFQKIWNGLAPSNPSSSRNPVAIH